MIEAVRLWEVVEVEVEEVQVVEVEVAVGGG